MTRNAHRSRAIIERIGPAAAGIAPEDINYVLCTHLHADHVGWNTRPQWPVGADVSPSKAADDARAAAEKAKSERESSSATFSTPQAKGCISFTIVHNCPSTSHLSAEGMNVGVRRQPPKG